MSIEASNATAPVAAPRRKARLLAWVVAVLFILAVAGVLVVKPLVTSALNGLGAALASFLQGLGAAVQAPFDEACDRVQQSAEVIALFGAPIECAPIEQTEWIDTEGRNELEFKFKFTGPKGTGQANVIAIAAESGFAVKHIWVTGPTAQSIELP